VQLELLQALLEVLLAHNYHLEQALLLEVLYKALLQVQREHLCVVKMLGVALLLAVLLAVLALEYEKE
jgi:hypothetical protein